MKTEKKPVTAKAAKFLGKVTAKTISATGAITEKTVDTIKATPNATSSVTKTLVSAIAEGYREVRPAEDEAEIEATSDETTPES
jgi:hypothetical protein